MKRSRASLEPWQALQAHPAEPLETESIHRRRRRRHILPQLRHRHNYPTGSNCIVARLLMSEEMVCWSSVQFTGR